MYPAPGAARGARYLGLPLVRGGRLLAAAHGGQPVLSEAVAVLVRAEIRARLTRDGADEIARRLLGT